MRQVAAGDTRGICESRAIERGNTVYSRAHGGP